MPLPVDDDDHQVLACHGGRDGERLDFGRLRVAGVGEGAQRGGVQPEGGETGIETHGGSFREIAPQAHDGATRGGCGRKDGAQEKSLDGTAVAGPQNAAA